MDPLRRRPKLIAGCDAAFDNNLAIGVVVIMLYPQLNILESVRRERQVRFPYIPGLLTFREGLVLLDCFRALHHAPDVILFDGQGMAHFRMLGLATHLGILLNKPSIGCAKSRLTGTHEKVGPQRGAYAMIKNSKSEIIGMVLRTKDHVKPVFISAGYRIILQEAKRIVLTSTQGFRLPEPLRQADHLTRS